MRRVRMLPSPGRANSDSAGDTSTSGASRIDRERQRLGQVDARDRSATLAARSSSMLRQHRDDALADRGHLHLGQLEAQRALDVLLLDRRLAAVEQRRLRVVIGELLRLAAHLVFLHRLRETT